MPSAIITTTPIAATSIVAKVERCSVSRRINHARNALKNGMALNVKSVFATVVFVMACRNAIPAPASNAPAINPGRPICTTFCTA